jgi:hypothetical protein
MQHAGKILSAETIELREGILTLSLAKSRLNAEEILKIYELFISGYIHSIPNSFRRTVIKCCNLRLRRVFHFFFKISYYQYIFITYEEKIQVKLYHIQLSIFTVCIDFLLPAGGPNFCRRCCTTGEVDQTCCISLLTGVLISS